MPTIEIIKDPKVVAKQAGLRYVSDTIPGFTRKKVGDKWHYFDTKDTRVTDKDEIDRINKLAVPPAYTDVWICPYANGHIQATGMDERGRKQYRYHADWQTARQDTKYQRMQAFGHALPKLRRQIANDINQEGMSREKVLATLVDLLQKTLIRVGNEEYAKENKSYGLTTMQNKHVEVDEHEITFVFKGKSNQYHEISLKDKKLAKVVQDLQDLPGQELFQYVDDNDNLHEIHSDDVNDYLQEVTGQEFTAKDFRTWRGTTLAAAELLKCEGCETDTEVKRVLNEALKAVSEELGNTPAVCRKAYIHPVLIETFIDSKNLDSLKNYSSSQLSKYKDLRKDEAVIMVFLESVS
jgi:DNA topoisomerase-1